MLVILCNVLDRLVKLFFLRFFEVMIEIEVGVLCMFCLKFDVVMMMVFSVIDGWLVVF